MKADAGVAALKRLAAGIIRVQGNRFIKELLRDKGIRIGVNKSEFQRNLMEAIETGRLAREDVKQWLDRVEGWGDQHVYLYAIPASLRGGLTREKIRRRVADARMEALWNRPTVLDYPDESRLTSITFADAVLRLVWHKASPGLTRVPEKDFPKEEGLDLYEYKAWRRIERRAVTRFEAHMDKSLAALFIPEPIRGEEHAAAVGEARRVIGLLMDSAALEAGRMNISNISRNLDQRNLPTNVVPDPPVTANKSRLASGGAYVEFASASRDEPYWKESAVKEVRRSVGVRQLPVFKGDEGVFIFQPRPDPDGLTRPLRVQLFGREDRIRLWARMDAREVWSILSELAAHQ